MKRPLSVTIAVWICIAVAVASFDEIRGNDFLSEAARLSGLVAGIWMLKGENWARWLAMAWIALHVGISAFHNLRELAIHAVFGIVIAVFLFRQEASRYFAGNQALR